MDAQFNFNKKGIKIPEIMTKGMQQVMSILQNQGIATAYETEYSEENQKRNKENLEKSKTDMDYCVPRGLAMCSTIVGNSVARIGIPIDYNVANVMILQAKQHPEQFTALSIDKVDDALKALEAGKFVFVGYDAERYNKNSDDYKMGHIALLTKWVYDKEGIKVKTLYSDTYKQQLPFIIGCSYKNNKDWSKNSGAPIAPGINWELMDAQFNFNKKGKTKFYIYEGTIKK